MRAALIVTGILVCASTSIDRAYAQTSPSAAVAARALAIVDCLLPGQVRILGGRSYLTPRRPTRTTGEDCAARGGEYLAYDRADYRSALQVWLPSAEAGDASAQTIVGEIYERGLGGEPDYAAAARWYRLAAEQNFTRAQFNLGTLYEHGLGVGEDRFEALEWYRRASGLSEDSLIFKSAAASRLEEQRSALMGQIADRDLQIDALSRQLTGLSSQSQALASDVASQSAQIEALTKLVDKLESDRSKDRAAIEKLTSLAETVRPPPGGNVVFKTPRQQRYRRNEFGRFFALIIGVQDYEHLEDLRSPANDVIRIAQLLEHQYGFSVSTLSDPDQISLMRAINQLTDIVGEEDNLLIYFAGHGSRLQSGVHETGYWLPVNADPVPDDTFWVPNDFISRHLGRLKARRVLVIADSCYSGLLGDEPGFIMVGDGRYTEEYVEWKRPKRSRLVLSSGVDSPITERTDSENSIFASALLDVLRSNSSLISAPELLLSIEEQLGPTDEQISPDLKALKEAGHEVGDFFFIASGE